MANPQPPDPPLRRPGKIRSRLSRLTAKQKVLGGIALGLLILLILCGTLGALVSPQTRTAKNVGAPSPAQVKPSSSPPANPPQSPTPSGMADLRLRGTVTDVMDGDTVVVRADRGSAVTVRILGIEAPEANVPNAPAQCWGKEATEFAQRTLAEKQVKVYADPSQDKTDNYGRWLAYLILPDGTNYAIVAARSGAARSYTDHNKPVTLHDDIAEAEQQAKATAAGLWGPPCNGRLSTPPATTPPAPQPPPAVTSQPPPPATSQPAQPATPAPPPATNVYYPNCAAVRAAGQAPLYRGQPGYRAGLDRDGDGIACE